jgi:putative transcriptional regulator
MGKAGDRLLKAAREMNAIARGKAPTLRMYVPAEIDVRALCKVVGLTQEAFANEFGFTLAQVRDWEQNRTRPVQGHRDYLLLLERHPEELRRMMADVRKHQEPSAPQRLARMA